MAANLNVCPACGTPLPSDGPQGLCPQCLLLRGLEESPTQVTPSDARAAAESPITNHPSPITLPKVHYFGDYELLEEIARGGMGVVYRARQVSLNRTVAVKMILAGQLASEAEIKRFRTEAEAAANLQHPNIVAIHEVGEHEGRHYFSMDYVAGRNLAEHAGGKPLPAKQAAVLVKTLGEAVHYAHQRGTLHRDLKPQNVLVDAEGSPRITDFGLAKRAQDESGLTRSGSVMGSPSYMPPEQAAGRLGEVGPQSDVYSLGAILYELLTGRPPFKGETPMATLVQVLEEEPVPPRKLNPSAPLDLETICLKCLEKRPERRYASARALAEELERFLNHEPILARPTSPIRKSWSWLQKHPWIIAGVVSVLLLGLSWLAYGFWEQTQYMTWRMNHPGQRINPQEDILLLTCWFGFALLGGLMGFAAPWFAAYYRRARETGQRIQSGWLLAYVLLGATALVYAAVLSVRTIRVLVWEQHPSVFGVFWGIAFMVWLGLFVLWQAVGIHESSAYLPSAEQSLEKEIEWLSRNTWIDPRARIKMFILFAVFVWLSLNCGVGVLLGVVLDDRHRALFAAAGGLSWLGAWMWGGWMSRLGSWKRSLLIAAGLAAVATVGYLAYTHRVDSGLAAIFICGACSGAFAAAAYSLHQLGHGRSGGTAAAGPMRPTVSTPRFGRMGRGYLVGLTVTGVVCGALGLDAFKALQARAGIARVKQSLKNQGVNLDWSALLATPVPDDQNFAKTPLLQAIGYLRGTGLSGVNRKAFAHLADVGAGNTIPVGDFRLGERIDLGKLTAPSPDPATNQLGPNAPVVAPGRSPALAVLEALAPVAPQLEELRQARRRPHGFLDPPELPDGLPAPNARAFRMLANLLLAHGTAALAADRTDLVAEDFRTLLRLTDVLRENQLLGGQLIRIGMFSSGLQIVWEGLVVHRWSEAELVEFQGLLQAVDLLLDLDRAHRRECAFFLEWFDESYSPFHYLPFSELLFRVNHARHRYLQLFQETRELALDTTRRRVFPAGLARSMEVQKQAKEQAGLWAKVFGQFLPDLAWVLPSVARCQTSVNLTLLACALERHRLAAGDYPVTLAELAPRFLSQLPHDLVNGQPLQYRRTDGGLFLLYSLGWDQVDDGGVDASGAEGKGAGDWVWHGRAKAAQ